MLPAMRRTSAWVGLVSWVLLSSACVSPEREAAPLGETERPAASTGVPEAPADPIVAPGGLRTTAGAPIVVVVETRDRSIAVTAELVRDPSRTDLRELRAPRVMADVEPALLLQPAFSP